MLIHRGRTAFSLEESDSFGDAPPLNTSRSFMSRRERRRRLTMSVWEQRTSQLRRHRQTSSREILYGSSVCHHRTLARSAEIPPSPEISSALDPLESLEPSMEEQNVSVVPLPDPPESEDSSAKDLYGNPAHAHTQISTTLELLDPLDAVKDEQDVDNAQLPGNAPEEFQDKNHLSVRRANGERRQRGTRKYSKYGKHSKHRNPETHRRPRDEPNADERSRSASRERTTGNDGDEAEEEKSNDGGGSPEERTAEDR